MIASENVVVVAVLSTRWLSAAEVDALIAEAIAATGATTIKDMGKVMAAVKPKAQGRADMGAVSARVKEKLAQSPGH